MEVPPPPLRRFDNDMDLPLSLLALASLPLLLPVAQEEAASDEDGMSFEEFVGSMDFQTGSVTIAGGDVTFELPEGWALLQSKEARMVVEDVWGNPADPSTLAFIDPPSDDGRLGSSYGVIVSIDESGFISDDDAADLDYDDLLESMQEGEDENNAARAEAGYESVNIVGWAESPRYDAAEKKLYWAKELKFGASDEHTLNYDVRILGRSGYLQLQAVAPMSAVSEVHAGMTSLLPGTNFSEGSRYSDFDSSIDKVAAIGIGGLIAGKVAAKVGLFAVFAKFGKIIILGIIGIFVAAKKFLFGGSKNEHAYEEPEAEAEEEA